jgi:type II secretory pathway pseudopilin PulG
MEIETMRSNIRVGTKFRTFHGWHDMNRRKAFTLIELLVAVGILMLLTSLILGGLGAARRKARKTHARNDVSQIATAWNMYYADYRRFPDAGPGRSFNIESMNVDAIQILRGHYDLQEYPAHDEYLEKNPRGTEFMDFHVATTDFADPWGHTYNIALDDGLYDGRVTVPQQDEALRRNVAVWSNGKDGLSGNADDVCSWLDR